MSPCYQTIEGWSITNVMIPECVAMQPCDLWKQRENFWVCVDAFFCSVCVCVRVCVCVCMCGTWRAFIKRDPHLVSSSHSHTPLGEMIAASCIRRESHTHTHTHTHLHTHLHTRVRQKKVFLRRRRPLVRPDCGSVSKIAFSQNKTYFYSFFLCRPIPRDPRPGTNGPRAGTKGPRPGTKGPRTRTKGPRPGTKGPWTRTKGPRADTKGPTARYQWTTGRYQGTTARYQGTMDPYQGTTGRYQGTTGRYHGPGPRDHGAVPRDHGCFRAGLTLWLTDNFIHLMQQKSRWLEAP